MKTVVRSHHSARVLFAILLLALGCGAEAPLSPNVVIFLADDLGWGDVGYHGGPIDTPSIDRLAREGVELDRFYAAPICSPTRAALMTGRDPLKLGLAYSVIFPWSNFGVSPEEHFISESFRAAGYQTAAIGKWHLGHSLALHTPNQRGFDSFFGHLLTNTTYYSHLNQGAPDLQRDGRTVKADGEYATTLAADEAVRFIERRDDSRPFFLYMPFIAPHSPLEAPQDLIDKYADVPEANQRRVFAAVVDAMDQAMGRVLDTLDAEEIADETIVLFFSDNGGAYNMGGVNTPLRGQKGQTFEGGIRVPAAVRWPAGLEGERRIDQVITVVDVFPTLAAAAGVTPMNTKPFDGRDLWREIETGVVTPRDDDIFFASEIPTAGRLYTTVLQDKWKLVQIVDQGLTETTVQNMLFLIAEDPNEEHDYASRNPRVVSDLARRINAWRAQRPIAGTRTQLQPHPGWRAPRDWAAAVRRSNEIQEGRPPGFGADVIEQLDRAQGERGRLIYE